MHKPQDHTRHSIAVGGSQVAIQVFARIRPPHENEIDFCIHDANETEIAIVSARDSGKVLKYSFGRVFDDAATQEQIFSGVELLLANCFEGKNVSILCYGPTGTGKTYSMIGPDDNPGVVPRAVRFLIDEMQKDSTKSTIKISFSFFEIYQEKVIDLLVAQSADLPIREDAQKHIVVQGLSEESIKSYEEFLKLYSSASDRRHKGATSLNEDSSRSHTIILLKILRKTEKCIKESKLYLIDLAGSENNKLTGNTGIRMKESGHINTSLFVLGQVVDALLHKLPRVPYRDSKLTRLLQDSLGGNALSLLICTLAPEQRFYQETYNCLNFGARTKQIMNKPVTNEYVRKFSPRKKRGILSIAGNESEVFTPGKRRRTMLPIDSDVTVKAGLVGLSPVVHQIQSRIEANMEFKLQSMARQLLSRCAPGNAASIPEDDEGTDSDAPSTSSQQTRSSGYGSGFCSRALADMKSPMKAIAEVDDSFSPGGFTACSTFIAEPRRRSVRLARGSEVPTATAPSVQVATLDHKEDRWRMSVRPDVMSQHNLMLLNILNEANLKQLQSLSTVGPKTAEKLLKYREQHGAFTRLEDLRTVDGLPKSFYDKFIKANLMNKITVQ